MFVAFITVRTPEVRDAATLLDRLPAGAPDGEVLRWNPTAREVIGLASRPEPIIAAARQVMREGGWSLGIGAGEVSQPLPHNLCDCQGEAFGFAQDAAARARRRRGLPPVAVSGAGEIAATDAEALLTILAREWADRSQAGWEAVASVAATGTEGPRISQQLAAARLGISQQALSQRLRAAGWAAEAGILPLLRRRLLAAEGREDRVPW